jgi:hypothetical protein
MCNRVKTGELLKQSQKLTFKQSMTYAKVAFQHKSQVMQIRFESPYTHTHTHGSAAKTPEPDNSAIILPLSGELHLAVL